MARAVVSRLLREPTRGLRGAGGEGTSFVFVQALRQLFGLEAALRAEEAAAEVAELVARRQRRSR